MYEFVGKKGQTYKIKLNYNCPADQKIGEGKGSCGGSDNKSSDKFDEISHAKGVLAARDLAGSAMGPNQKQVNEATKTLQKNSVIPSNYKIRGNSTEIEKIYTNKPPVIGDIFEMKDGTTAEVIKMYDTPVGNVAIDINIIGKKSGRISTVYLKTKKNW